MGLKDRERQGISIFNVIMVLLAVALTVGILLTAYYFKPSAVSNVYAAGAVWNSSSALRTGENIRLEHTDREGCLTIPVPEGTALETLKVENDYAENIVRIIIPDVSEDFFREHFFSGDMRNIDTFRYGFEGDNAVIELVSSGFYETTLDVEEDRLYASLIPAHEKYDKIVVIDAAFGGDDTGSMSYGILEKDITLKLSRAIEELSDSMDLDYHIYYTRSGDETVSNEARAALVRDTDADIYIGLYTDADTDTRVTHGITAYYWTDSNKNLANELVHRVAQETGSKENPSFKSEGSAPYTDISDREIDLCVGYITNKRDAITAGSEKFAKRAANAVISILSDHFAEEE